jgi:hypothetical protein
VIVAVRLVEEDHVRIVAVTRTCVSLVTLLAVTVKLLAVEPAGTVTEEGVLNSELPSLIHTCTPLPVAGCRMVTTHAPELDEMIVCGMQERL